MSGFCFKILSAIFSHIFLEMPKTSKADNDSSLTLLSTNVELFSSEVPNFNTLSFKSTIILSAVLAPTPFTFCSSALFLLRIACAMSFRSNEESRISAIISEIPILNSKKIQDIIAFMKNLVILLHDMIDRRLKVMELEEEILQSYEELEASYQDVSELNDKLTILNQDLLLKNNIVSQSEKRNQILIDKVKQGIMILNFSIDFSKEIPFYRVRYINKAMRNIINYLSDDIDINSIESELIKYVLINAKHGNLAKEEKRTFHCGENDKYYEIEYEKLSENELMVCILDVTDHKRKIEWQKKQIWDIVSAMGKLVEKRDLYTADHQKKVAILATRIAISLGIERKRIESVFIASLLHDIGKISIPSEILTKPDKLSDIEYELMKTHVLKAYEILKDINFEMPVAEIVKQHHEKINGSGYPDRLAGQEIMLESKIIAVSDVYEAITSHRPYRPSLGVEFAEKHLEAEKGVLYDIEVVEACLKVVESQQWGIDDVYKYLYN